MSAKSGFTLGPPLSLLTRRWASLLAPRSKPKSLQQTVFYPTVWSVKSLSWGAAVVLAVSKLSLLGLGAPLSMMHWGTDEGLGPGAIGAILQTRDGYLWFGSEEG